MGFFLLRIFLYGQTSFIRFSLRKKTYMKRILRVNRKINVFIIRAYKHNPFYLLNNPSVKNSFRHL